MDDSVLMAAVAGLLHDLGKFAHRAGEHVSSEVFGTRTKEEFGSQHALLTWHVLNRLLPNAFNQIATMAAYHYPPMGQGSIVQAINLLSPDERQTSIGQDDSDMKNHPRQLQPVFSAIEIDEHQDQHLKFFPLQSLRLEKSIIFPSPELTEQSVWANYKLLWASFSQEAEVLKKTHEQQPDLEKYLDGMLSLMQRYAWCVPSDYFSLMSDISLYDHGRLTAALAACLTADNNAQERSQALSQEQTSKPIMILMRGDLSGIQKFIYRLAQPDATTEHIAKRLRGRSFYLQLLVESIAHWLLGELDLPSVCAVMENGGRFDLLLPLSTQQKAQALTYQIQEWLLKEFHGELGINFAFKSLISRDFEDSREAFRDLDDAIEKQKRHRWFNFIHDEQFFFPKINQWHVCNVCHLTPLADPGTCSLCDQHANIGTHLPKVSHLAFYEGPIDHFPMDQVVSFDSAPFAKVHVLLIKGENDIEKALSLSGHKRVFAINKAEYVQQHGQFFPLRFFANTAPRAIGSFAVYGNEAIADGNILHFEAIASLSRGAERLGILKADVDRLGFLMSEGLKKATLSRVVTLSRNLDLFFAGYLNTLCEQVAIEWRKKHTVTNSSASDGLFYVMYSGGDDLFIVGPWDATLFLAQQIQTEFQNFVAENPYLTLSAGYVQVKPRYPTQKFAELVDEAEKQAKNDGRNRLAAFGESMPWLDTSPPDLRNEASFAWLSDIAQDWIAAIDSKELPSTLIYDLGRLFRQHSQQDGRLKLMWTPRLYYTLARRLKEATRKRYQDDIFKVIASRKTLVPVSIASLTIRERSK